MRVNEILRHKGTEVVCVSQDKSVYEAVQVLVERNIGSLLVIDSDERVVGIITERDVLKECNKRFDRLNQTKVSEVMTRNLIVASPTDDVDYVQAVMTQNRIRHLPIIEEGRKLAGMVSIGDVVKVVHAQIEVENRDLKEFISTKYLG